MIPDPEMMSEGSTKLSDLQFTAFGKQKKLNCLVLRSPRAFDQFHSQITADVYVVSATAELMWQLFEFECCGRLLRLLLHEIRLEI